MGTQTRHTLGTLEIKKCVTSYYYEDGILTEYLWVSTVADSGDCYIYKFGLDDLTTPLSTITITTNSILDFFVLPNSDTVVTLLDTETDVLGRVYYYGDEYNYSSFLAGSGVGTPTAFALSSDQAYVYILFTSDSAGSGRIEKFVTTAEAEAISKVYFSDTYESGTTPSDNENLLAIDTNTDYQIFTSSGDPGYLYYYDGTTIKEMDLGSGVGIASISKVIYLDECIYLVTNTNPAYIIKIEVGGSYSYAVPNITSQELTGYSFATDIGYGSGSAEYLYVSCADGKIVKVNRTTISSYSVIDFSDTDELTSACVLAWSHILFSSTNSSSVGEFYEYDSQTATSFGTNFSCNAGIEETFGTHFATLEGVFFNSNFSCLAETDTFIKTNLSCLSDDYDSIVPIARTDWHVYIDNVELTNGDLLLESCQISHTIDSKSTASFVLARRHDQINKTLAGSTVTISNRNAVKIYIGSNLEFNGTISELNMSYAKSTETVQVEAIMEQPTEEYNSITLPLPSLTEKIGLYHIFIQNPRIYNPLISATDLNPDKYLGIRVSAGKQTTENISQWTSFGDTVALATDIIEGTFKPSANYTYFWFAIVKKSTITVDGTTPFNIKNPIMGSMAYVGTSLSGINTPLYKLTNASWKKQRERVSSYLWLGDGTITAAELEEMYPTKGTTIFNALVSRGYVSGTTITDKFKKSLLVSDTEVISTYNTEFDINLGDSLTEKAYNALVDKLGYTVGTAPFKEVSCTSGIFIPKEHWVDRDDGLYAYKEDSYNYVGFCNKVADLEFTKMKNINGDVLPLTSIDIGSTLDAYYYYRIKLLSRINISNTTEANIYNNANGFPVAVKRISLDASTMMMSLSCDNSKSETELKVLDGLYPDEEDYIKKGYNRRNYAKVDLQSMVYTE